MKKNFLRTPSFISAKLGFITEDEVIITAIRSFSKKEIEANLLSKIAIRLNKDELYLTNELIPMSESGRYSRRNRDGYSIIRKDLPKIYKTISCGTRYPFGNTSLTPYELCYEKLVYQKEFIQPKNWTLSIELLDSNNKDGNMYYTFKVGLSNSLDKTKDEFETNILFALNLLQENFGKVDVFSTSTTKQEFMSTQNVAWEIFPAGERDENLERILNGMSKLTPQDKENIKDKYDFLTSMNPESIILGAGGMSSYFGAKFTENLVVFENLEYGNAIYVMYDEWEGLSKMTRTELLSMENKKFDRVKHTENWKNRISYLVYSKLKQLN
ncbi:hypothetical protein [Arcicella rosea]|uniref:Uncharacterized protein n=1 Tax=Arcicella rosea TaxID=502909 RepID=A0A841EJ57_9BACT|nr:hypothetical protein [Arcicella rosea]MBB6001429.1 hypothetical protein [Arcicella rosea]